MSEQPTTDAEQVPGQSTITDALAAAEVGHTTTCHECGDAMTGGVIDPGYGVLCTACADNLAARGLLAPDSEEVERLAADAPPGDTYGREQAARLLGVSPRRVSQLAADGRMEVVQAKPLRLSAESVHRLREERRSPSRDTRATVPPEHTPEESVAAQVERVVSLFVAEHRRAIEAGEHLLAEVTTQRDEYRAEVERLRAEVEAERAARSAVEQQAAEQAAAPKPRRRWWPRAEQ